MPRRAPRPLVLVDADDTLWENFRFFADVVAAWARWMQERGVPASRATATLEECEDRNIPRWGYGSAPFAASLREAHGILRPDAPPAERSESRDFTAWAEGTIRNHPITLLAGVDEACAELAPRARLVLFTKGREDEQLSKFERSGLARHFHGARVVADKRTLEFVRACAGHRAAPAAAWMVGNSARSDINPARLAGLRTIHVPHPAPWHRDEEPLVAAGLPTLVARTFADVPRYFSESLATRS